MSKSCDEGQMTESRAREMLVRLSPGVQKEKRITDKGELIKFLRAGRNFYLENRAKNGSVFIECKCLESLSQIVNTHTDIDVRLEAVCLLITLCIGLIEEKDQKDQDHAFSEGPMISLSALLNSSDVNIQKQALKAIGSIVDSRKFAESFTSSHSSLYSATTSKSLLSVLHSTQAPQFFSSTSMLFYRFGILIHSSYLRTKEKSEIIRLSLLLLQNAFSPKEALSSSSTEPAGEVVPDPATQFFLDSITVYCHIMNPHDCKKWSEKGMEEVVKKFGRTSLEFDPTEALSLWSYAFGILETVKRLKIAYRPPPMFLVLEDMDPSFFPITHASGEMAISGRKLSVPTYTGNIFSFVLNHYISSDVYKLDLVLNQFGSSNPVTMVGLADSSQYKTYSSSTNCYCGQQSGSASFYLKNLFTSPSIQCHAGGTNSATPTNPPVCKAGDVLSLEVDMAKQTLACSIKGAQITHHFIGVPRDVYFVISFGDTHVFTVEAFQKLMCPTLDTSKTTAVAWK